MPKKAREFFGIFQHPFCRETSDSFSSFVNQNAKQTTTGTNGGTKHQIAQDATKVFSSHQP